MPNHLNLLDYSISEICMSYSADFVDPWQSWANPMMSRRSFIRKVIVLWNFVPDCKFAALVLRNDRGLSYWKFGDEHWTPIDANGYCFNDAILCNERCYAVDDEGALVSFDSKWNLTVVALHLGHYMITQNYLVECGSDLYLVSKISLQDHWSYYVDFQKRTGDKDMVAVDFELILNKFNKCNGNWDCIEDAGDVVFVLCDDDASLCISAKDFGGCKGNTVYLTDWSFMDGMGNGDIYETGVYHLDDGRAYLFPMSGDSGKVYWPPPSWLCA